MKEYIFHFGIFLFLSWAVTGNVRAQYLKRSLSAATEINNEISTETAHYVPLFGAGDKNSGIIKGISRYGYLLLDPGGASKDARYENEEHILFLLGGTGILKYNNEEIPISKNDFIYIPEGTNFKISNPREQSLSVIIMGFRLLPGGCIRNTTGLMIANTDEVKFQTLPSHGPTTRFQLLIGTTESTRDRLAAACQVTSLFIMDFAAGGTNNPHRHSNEEEIYLLLRDRGDIVAGENPDGSEYKIPSGEGDVYFFSPNTLIGFYSMNSPEEEHVRILAVRFKYPVEGKKP